MHDVDHESVTMITMRHSIAVDAGGTSTRAMVINDDGICLGIGFGGRGNPISDGAESAAQAISAAVTAALISSGLAGDAIDAVSVAMAGGNSLLHKPEWLRDPLDRLGIAPEVVVEPDLLAMFCAGTPQPGGYALIAGTGAIAAVIGNGHVERFADGVGWLLGDTGSGFWIGREVARAVTLALHGREPETTLVEPTLTKLGITTDPRLVDGRPASLNALVRHVYARSPLALAQLAPLAFADPDDPVSARIIDTAAAALADSVLTVYRPDIPGPLVIGGGVLNGQPRLREATLSYLAQAGVELPLVTVRDGLVGAGVLVLRRLGITVDDAIFTTLHRSTSERLSNQTS